MLINSNVKPTRNELEIIKEHVKLKDAHILDLGCGRAEKAITISREGATVVAMEVDSIQHTKNMLLAESYPNIQFKWGGAEEIPYDSYTFDAVFMFKSLHHVPENKLDQALREIHRVLKPKGIAFIAEPIFDGEFNEIIRLFHDEERVRILAFNALKNAVNSNLFQLKKQVFYKTLMGFKNFDDFSSKVLNVTHSHFQIDNELLIKIKELFNKNATENGSEFLADMRVDILEPRNTPSLD